MSLHQRLFLVTGANKGIGFEVVKKLAVNHPTDLILLGSRDQERGEETLAQLGSPSNVKVLVLDTSSKENIEQAKEEIEKKYGGYIDVLINNDGIFNRGLGFKVLQEVFNTNFYGVKLMNNIMSPLLRDNGRIVNVSSGAGTTAMKHCSSDLKSKFLDPDLTETQLEQLFEPLFKAVKDGNNPRTAGFDPLTIRGFEGDSLLYYAVVNCFPIGRTPYW